MPRHEPTQPTVVSVLMQGLARNAWSTVPDGGLDGLVGGGLDSIAVLAQVVRVAFPPMFDAIARDASGGRP